MVTVDAMSWRNRPVVARLMVAIATLLFQFATDRAAPMTVMVDHVMRHQQEVGGA